MCVFFKSENREIEWNVFMVFGENGNRNVEREKKIIEKTSWDRTVEMHSLRFRRALRREDRRDGNEMRLKNICIKPISENVETTTDTRPMFCEDQGVTYSTDLFREDLVRKLERD